MIPSARKILACALVLGCLAVTAVLWVLQWPLVRLCAELSRVSTWVRQWGED